LTTTSKQNFWERFEADAKSYVQPDELLIVNRLGGIVQLTGSLRTHALLEDYINRLMARVRRHATITVRAIRVDINNSNALGVDLTAALQEIAGEAHIGGSFTPVTIGGTAPYSTTSGTGTVTGAGSSNYGTIGNIAIGSPTVQTVVTAGKVSALVTALSKQGAVTVTDTTTAATLNNQMALIQVTQDLPFFARSNSTNYNPGGSTTTGVPPVETSNYTEQTVSFGSVLEVTPQISDDLVSTIVVAPSVTEFLGTVTSPDLSSTAPNTGTRRYRSTYVLRNHESAVIGAFMEGTKGKQTSGVPGISSIPIIGYMFKTTAGLSSRSEFIIVMTVDAEDGSVPQPRTLAMPLADQARRDLGGAISPELKDELDPQPPQPKPVRGKKAAAVPPASKVELVGSPTS
jgi:type II secretory pathway component GspD/PulD (secretin)